MPRLVDKSDDGCGTSTARRFRATFLSFLLLLLLHPFPCISACKLLKFVATRRKICTRARCRIVGRCAPTNFSHRILPVSLFLFFSRPIDVVSRLNIAHVSRFCQVLARSNFLSRLSQGFVNRLGMRHRTYSKVTYTIYTQPCTRIKPYPRDSCVLRAATPNSRQSLDNIFVAT